MREYREATGADLGWCLGETRDGIGRLAVPILKLIDESGRDFDANECIHESASPATRTWMVSVLPEGTGLFAPDLTLYGFRLDGPRTVSLSVGSTPGESASGEAILEPPALRLGWISQWRSIHRCEGSWAAYPCEACGFPHSPWNACSHEDDRAAVLDDEADCTCSNVFVHVAWRDTDGDGVADKDEERLVRGPDVRYFVALGEVSHECCCGYIYGDGCAKTARLLSHTGDIRIFDYDGELLSPGSTSTVFAIQGVSPSPSVCGSHFSYELLDRTNGVLRTLHVPVTAWDIWDTGLAFNWATNSHASDAIILRHGYGTPIDYTLDEAIPCQVRS